MRHNQGRYQVVLRDAHAPQDRLILPPASDRVISEVRWGRHECLFTPAYWAAQAWYHAHELAIKPIRLGATLLEEVVACLLGGYGIPAEVGLAAFEACRIAGLLAGCPIPEAAIHATLSRPIEINGKKVRYRFAKQKSRYIADAIVAISSGKVDLTSALGIRNSLTLIKGVGLKTASWIARNWFDSDDVAILDVHIVRAGRIVGLFSEKCCLLRDYIHMEQVFLRFADRLKVRASRLDALMWRQMKSAGHIAIEIENQRLKERAISNSLLNAA